MADEEDYGGGGDEAGYGLTFMDTLWAQPRASGCDPGYFYAGMRMSQWTRSRIWCATVPVSDLTELLGCSHHACAMVQQHHQQQYTQTC